jgi:hypothetical protein
MNGDIIFGERRVATERRELDWSALGEPMEPGIYFGLPEQDYFAAAGVSSSLLKALSISPLTAWSEHVDPNREDEPTEAQDLGTALHKRILEGDAMFRRHFAVRPENDGYHIEGVTELKARCKELGLKVGGTTADLCKRIREADPEAKLWADVIAAWEDEHRGKIAIKEKDWIHVEFRAGLAERLPFIRNAFSGGFPEVSIFWTDEEGMPCKARVDYLKVDVAVDLKYFANKRRVAIDRAVGIAVANEGHHVQARHYRDGLLAAREHIRAGRVFGDETPDQAWRDAFVSGPEHRWFWVFMQKGAAPEIRVREFRRTVPEAKDGATENALWTAATDRIEASKKLLRWCLECYGAEPWLAEEPPRPLRDEDVPPWAMD